MNGEGLVRCLAKRLVFVGRAIGLARGLERKIITDPLSASELLAIGQVERGTRSSGVEFEAEGDLV